MTTVAILLVAGALFYFALPPLLKRLIRRRLGAFTRLANEVDEATPLRLGREVSVAVLGSGIAGITAALTLSRRGYQVSLFEKNSFIGGKLGSWPVQLEPGRTVWVSHGFHAFFPHYHNLNRLLDSVDARKNFVSVGDYVILGRDGQELRFAGLDKTPVFNLLSMWKKGAFSLADALGSPGRDYYGIFLEYDEKDTFSQLDHLSFAEFSRRAQLPPRLKLAFSTFARAFFADEEKLSMAELVKSFHFYYLSHDGGLVYDYPDDDYEPTILRPLREEFERQNIALKLNTEVTSLRRDESSFQVNEQEFDKVIMATDVVGASHILSNAEGFPQALTEQFSELRPGQRYGVLRVWIDRDIRTSIPVFVITERLRMLDSVTVLHRIERSTQEDQKKHPGYVLELHCYCVPDHAKDSEVRGALLGELVQFFPELEGLKIAHESFQLRQDFTAFHTGMYENRPSSATDVKGLHCAGDWVKLPFPAMLLEAACASGLCAANGILREDGLREEPVLSVPLRGLMAGLPAPPGRKGLFVKQSISQKS